MFLFVVFTRREKKRIKDSSHLCNMVLRRPNPYQGGADFFTSVITNKMLFGESYLLLTEVKEDDRASHLELYLTR